MGKTNRSFKFKVEHEKRTGHYVYQSKAKSIFDTRPRKLRDRKSAANQAIRESAQ